ncbi:MULTISPECIES: hypothetical protein [unclassified Flavobacterium]|uniref:hypothetical protein n=1 Tax=unclassified Flavobacterium TaxID=196869 RepID=UPI0006ABE59D|nr:MULTISPECIES: hypothetical protein [unclassified Flavobacterium]KOP39802.1 hypothetical protein AKO67_02655 [Flavobacterium sp. VMW]OWU92589.1 hypothetical protein APR43_00570 [Flavobacterium sp. NLM]
MGIKVIKSSFFVVVFLFSITSYSQITDTKIKFIKRYAYCGCVYINNLKLDEKYLNDKFRISDKSSNEFIELSKISDYDSEKIRDFTEKLTENFYSIESPYYSESGNSNTITSMCLEFYDSKELDFFVKKLIKESSRKKK